MVSQAAHYCLRWNNHQTNLLSAFDQLLRQGSFTDVTLACEDGVTFHVHRLVLASCSPYFRSLFTETASSHHPIVILKDVKASEMRSLIHFMYRGEVNIEHSRIKQLLRVASSLQVKGLVEDLLQSTQTQPISLVTKTCTETNPLSSSSSELDRGGTTSPDTSANHESFCKSSNVKEEDAPNIPKWRPFQTSPVPWKFPKLDVKEENIPSSIPSNHCYPYFSSYLMPNVVTNHSSNLFPPKTDFSDDILKVPNERKDQDSSSIPSCDQRDVISSSIPYPPHLTPNPVSQSLSPKSLKQNPVSSLFPSGPLLQTALAHSRPFHHDINTIASFTGSMIPLPHLLSAQTRHYANHDEMTRSKESDSIEIKSPFKGPSMPKIECLGGEDSKFIYDVSRDDLGSERLPNGTMGSEFTVAGDHNGRSQVSNFVSYVPTPKPEWKRYKQYTKSDLMQAIDAVKKGMTALQASRKFKVPSRTLYDKIKKMGVNTLPRRLPTKRSSNTHIEGMESSYLFHSPYLVPDRRIPYDHGDIDSDKNIDSLKHRVDGFDPTLTMQAALNLNVRDIKIDAKDVTGENDDVSGRVRGDVASTRASFSVLDRNFLPRDEVGPLDLTDAESGGVPTRQEIQEKA